MNPNNAFFRKSIRSAGRVLVLLPGLFSPRSPAAPEMEPPPRLPAPAPQALPPVSVSAGLFTAYGMEAERKTLAGRLAALEKELAQNRATQADLAARLEEANQKLAEPRVDPAVEKTLREELSRALADLETVRRDLAETEEAAAAKERVFLSNLDSAVGEGDALRLKLQENAQGYEQAVRQAAELSRQLGALQEIKTRTEQQVVALSTTLKAAQSDLDGLRQGVDAAEKLRAEAQSAAAEGERRVADLQRQVEGLSARPDITRPDLDLLNGRLAEAGKERESLNARLAERTEAGRLAAEMLKRKEDEIAALQQTSSEFARKLAEAEEQVGRLNQKVRSGEEGFRDLQTSMSAEREKLTADLAAREQMIAGQRKALEEQQAASAEAARLKAGVEEQLSRLKEQLAGEQKRRGELEQLAKKHEALRGEISDLSRFLTDTEKDRQSQIENLAALSAERDRLKRKVADYERDAARQREEQEKQRRLLEEIRQTIKTAGGADATGPVDRLEVLNEQLFRHRGLLEQAGRDKADLEVRLLAMEAELARVRGEARGPDPAALDKQRAEQAERRREIEELKRRVAEREKTLADTLKNRAEAEALVREMEAKMKEPGPPPPAEDGARAAAERKVLELQAELELARKSVEESAAATRIAGQYERQLERERALNLALKRRTEEQAVRLAEQAARAAPPPEPPPVPVEPAPPVPEPVPGPAPAPPAESGPGPEEPPTAKAEPAPSDPPPRAEGNADGTLEQARLLLRNQKAGEAAELFRSLLGKDETAVEARVGLAYALNLAGDADGARAEIARALAAEPFHPRALGLKAILEWLKGDTESSLQSIRLAVSRAPRDALLHNYLGIILNERGEIQAALAALRTAVELDPALVQAHFNLAVLLARPELQDLESSRRHYEESIKLGGETDERLEKIFHP